MEFDLTPKPASIKDGSTDSFIGDVVEASQTMPVLVDFWASWCGPCKQLTPALERAVSDAGGKIALVKIDADAHQQLAAQMRVQSLPTVIAFWQGQPVDGFMGALPPSEIKAFIDRVLRVAAGGSAGGAGSGDAAGGVDAALEQAAALMQAGDPSTAAALYQQILEALPETVAASVGLAEALLALGQAEQAVGLLDGLDDKALAGDAALKQRAGRVRAAKALADDAAGAGDLAALEAAAAANPSDLAVRFDLAIALQGAGRLEGAGDALLAIIGADQDWEDGKARAQLLKLFEAAGPTDPFTTSYRRKLSSLLFR